MDRHALAMLIPILALAIPVAAVILSGMQKIAKLRLEETRLRVTGGADEGEIQAMRGEMDAMRRELNELSERVDFAERLLANPSNAKDRL
jgi:hypothetical protein